jgi:hypothetical protein
MAREGWQCDLCGMGFPNREQAQGCESNHLSIAKMIPLGAEWDKGDLLPTKIYFIINGNMMLRAAYKLDAAPPRHLLMPKQVANDKEKPNETAEAQGEHERVEQEPNQVTEKS